LIVGDDEAGEESVNVRRRGDKKQEAMKIGEFAEWALGEVAAKAV
jgi:threonyl-tRNA synthetase